jgi:UDP-N-acetylglucosamine/UDP-N-acetylgalactosamine diphosphorylase
MTEARQRRIKTTRHRLARHGQEQLLRFADELSESQLRELLADIDSLELDMLDELIEQNVIGASKFEISDEILPPPVYPIEPTPERKDKYEQARQLGRSLIGQGKVAAFVVAGGMGTRLGFDGPKGCYPATPIRKKVLFQVFADKIQAIQNRYDGVICWYVMTSQANHQTTKQAFADNDYYGLKPDNVILFQQGMMPSFDHQGKILLREKHRLALSPDGHGGSLLALHKSGALADMEKRGVEYISYWQVDNPHVHVIDPLFIGLHVLDGAEISSKAVIKCDPL